MLEHTTNTEPVSGVQYSLESRPPLKLSGSLFFTGGRQNRKSPEWTVLIANFRLFSLYFRVNSVDKSYRKAIINYLCESNTKIGENRRKSAKIGENRRKSAKIGENRQSSSASSSNVNKGSMAWSGPPSSRRRYRVFLAFI